VTACPKPEKPVRGTKAAKEWMGLVAQLPCVRCGRYGVQLHHCAHDRGAQRRSSDFDVLPLCAPCHDWRTANGKTWRTLFGPDHGMLDAVRAQVEHLRNRTIGGRP
jgi:hypothetical protein